MNVLDDAESLEGTACTSRVELERARGGADQEEGRREEVKRGRSARRVGGEDDRGDDGGRGPLHRDKSSAVSED